MKALVHQLRTGRVELVEVPEPAVQDGHVLIRTTRSVVSAGTERMLLEFGRGSWLQKLRQQPDAVRAVWDKIRRDGLKPTLRAVSSKLDSFTPLGYCNAGIVQAVGRGVTRFAPGDRVASNGSHAGLVAVPQNLVAAIPATVTDEEAAFTPLAAVALQGIRLAEATLGETVVVIGLGLIGLLTAQLLRAAGCVVLGLDTAPAALQRAVAMGIATPEAGADPQAWVQSQTAGRGADAVLIATAGQSQDPVALATAIARQRGRIVLVGTADVRIDRNAFFRKELTFQVSSSYGPGRYDPAYEGKGQDYPIGYVRWTAGRNFEAVLHAMASGSLQVAPLIATRQPLDAYEPVYADLQHGGTTVFEYPAAPAFVPRSQVTTTTTDATNSGGAGLIGAGAFAQSTLLPILQKLRVPLRHIASANGLSAGLAARRFGIHTAGNDAAAVFSAPNVSQVFIATRHDSHARLAVDALQAGKHVFVEKPLALSRADLAAVQLAAEQSRGTLTVGFNRRFAPLATRLKDWAGDGTGLHVLYTVNAGALPPGHWASDPVAGGGRLLGEGCHFIDFCAFLCNAPVVRVCTLQQHGSETASILLQLENGSTASVQYCTEGSGRYDKERIEAYRGGQTALLSNWTQLELWSAKGRQRYRHTQDKGHFQLLQAVTQAASLGGPPPIPLSTLLNSSLATLAAGESAQHGNWMPVPRS